MCLTVFTGICTVRTTVYSNVNVNVNNKSSIKEVSCVKRWVFNPAINCPRLMDDDRGNVNIKQYALQRIQSCY